MTVNQNRVRKGVSTGGQFSAQHRAESSVQLPRTSDRRSIDESVDYAVSAIMDGPLSRGVVNGDKRQKLVSERFEALKAGRMSFVAGMDDTLANLYRAKGAEALQVWQADLATSGVKRAGKETRESWRQSLQHIPDSVPDDGVEEFERGRLHGALVLSGLQDDFDTSNPTKRVPLTEDNGYTADIDKETGVVKSHIRLVDGKPEDHPSGTPALATYWPTGKVAREVHYRNGKLHDGSGGTPTEVVHLDNQHADGDGRARDQEWYANSGVRVLRGVPGGRHHGITEQDSPDGQPASVWQHSDGSTSIQYKTAGMRQDPAPGKHAMVDVKPDGSTVKHHMHGRMAQHDPDDDTPAVIVLRADGRLERTVRYFNGTPWDGRKGEPSITEYSPDGSIGRTLHAGMIQRDSGYPSYPVRDTPITEGCTREDRDWLTRPLVERI